LIKTGGVAYNKEEEHKLIAALSKSAWIKYNKMNSKT
jgi:hypothetical protein